MLNQKTSDLLSSATSLPESVDGAACLSSLESQKAFQYGPVPVLVNRLAPQAQSEAFPTKDTCGHLGLVSSRSVDLQRLLASKLQVNPLLNGSILYQVTWKERVTPLQRRICALRGSVRRISDKDFIVWPTCTARD
jgi:hypothetical protein